MIYKRALTKSKTKFGFGFILVLAGMVLISRLWQAAALSLWLGQHEFSFIDQQGDSLIIKTIIPEYKKMITWILPESMPVEAVYNYGPYQWKKLFELGEIDNRGGLTLMRSSQKIMGLTVKGWRVDKATNLSWLDRIKWWHQETFLVKQKLIFDLSGEINWQSNSLVNEQTFSQMAAGESLSLSLINGDDLSKVITNHGIELVSVVTEAAREKTELWVKDDQNLESVTVAWLKMLLPEMQVATGTVPGYWSDLVLIIGKDYN